MFSFLSFLSIKTVKHCCALLAIRIHFPYFSYRIGLCLSESRRGSEFRDVISAQRYWLMMMSSSAKYHPVKTIGRGSLGLLTLRVLLSNWS